ncbi:MAG: right-handed parallel beta-helix repeat-containing protein [Verrucomicrobiota bacterium]
MRSIVVLVFALAGSALGQGSLTPLGAPAPIGKTLDQVEPRIDVQRTFNPLPTDASNQVIINTAGSYYLTANLVVTKTNAISITVSGVTLDLNGFQISRASGTGGIGVVIASNTTRCVVRNGAITGFGTGVQCVTAAPLARGGSFSQLSVSGCSTVGLLAGDAWEVRDCRSTDNGSTGISAALGVRMRDCVVAGNGAGGITAADAAILDGCIATGNTGTAGIQVGAGSTLTGCVATDNVSSSGIAASFGSSLRDCIARDNTSAAATSQGIFCNGECQIVGCLASGNTNTNVTASNNTGIGIRVVGNALIRDCVTQGNKGDGIQVSSRCTVRDNVSDGNGAGGTGAGIHVTSAGSRIEANQLTSNDAGLTVDSGDNVIIRNTARGNTTAFVLAADNHFGAIINRAGAGTPAVNGPAAASNLTTSDPWANFTH